MIFKLSTRKATSPRQAFTDVALRALCRSHLGSCSSHISSIQVIEGSLEVKLPKIWTDEKQRWSRRIEKRREEEKKREDQRRESLRRKKIQVREKVGKSRNTVFFQWFVAPEGRKVGSLKRRVRSQLARWEMKNCTPLWREAHFQAKMHKTHARTAFGNWDVEKVHAVVKMHITHQLRTSFGSWDVEKVHAVVARSTFASEKAKSTSRSEHVWKLSCLKSARRCGAKHMSKSKCTRHTSPGPLLEVEMSKKCTPLWREAHFEVKMLKAPGVRTTFGRSDVVSRGRRKGLCTLSKVSKTCGFCSISKNDGRPRHLKRICKDAFSVAGAELLGGPGADFLRRIAFWSLRSDDFVWQVQHFVWPGITFSWGAVV